MIRWFFRGYIVEHQEVIEHILRLERNFEDVSERICKVKNFICQLIKIRYEYVHGDDDGNQAANDLAHDAC